jgi:ferric iron reductase protein FhuF
MSSSLKPEEMEILSKDFRLVRNISSDSSYSIASKDFLHQEKCLAYLNKVTDILPASTKVASVSQFSKRYAFLTFGSGLYSMTMYNKGLDYSINNCYIESNYHRESWIPNLRLLDWHVTEPEDENWNKWRDQMIQTIFAENIAKVWEVISKVVRIPSSVLWENTAISVYWMYEKKMREEASENQKERILEDYHYLLSAPADLFGTAENPLTKFDSPKSTTASSVEPIRMRKTCCYYYQTPANIYCRTCPRKK